MQIINHGKPSFDELEAWQKSLLLDPLVEVIKDFYKQEKNRQAYEQWLADGKPMLKNLKQEVVYEQQKMCL